MKLPSLGCASGFSSLVRPKFGPGMLLQHDDLELLNDHTRELSRLLFRSFFGCGVVCGLKVVAEIDDFQGVRVDVETGLGLTRGGDPIYVPSKASVSIDKKCLGDRKQLWVYLCRQFKSCAPRAALCDSEDDDLSTTFTKVRDAYEVHVAVGGLEAFEGSCPCNTDKANGDKDQALNRDDDDEHCLCANPSLPCYKNHYDGICSGACGGDCDCGGDCGCGRDCIVLAKLDFVAGEKVAGKEPQWNADYTVRRFIRPVLMSDPETRPKDKPKDSKGKGETKPHDQARASEQPAVVAEGGGEAGVTAGTAGGEAQPVANALTEAAPEPPTVLVPAAPAPPAPAPEVAAAAAAGSTGAEATAKPGSKKKNGPK